VTLSNEVEGAEASVIAGHTGHPEVVQNTGRKGRRRRRTGQAGRGTFAKERPPVFGMRQRGGAGGINLRAKVKPKTLEPCMQDTMSAGTLV
jgi:transposase